MYKVGVCGHLAFGEQFNSGQKDKTMSVYSALYESLGPDEVTFLDTRNWKKSPVKFAFQCVKLAKECKNIVILADFNGIRVLPFLFEALNVFFKRKLHFSFIGGWLIEFLQKRPKITKALKKLDCVYTEVALMKIELENLGFTNVYYMPNFRKMRILTPEELYIPESEPYKFCTFSRIRYEKGIEDAIEAVRYVNRTLGRVACTLDIYGLPDDDYKERFNELQKSFEPFIRYGGFVDSTHESFDFLSTYFALLFPTKYKDEGFPGTIIDAFCAGLPVISADWKYREEAVVDGVNGIVYNGDDQNKLKEILLQTVQNPDVLNQMRINNLNRAGEFSSELGVAILLKTLESSTKPEETL
ncbi:MAG: glycosyltransferase [Clostridia bacterium]|nr:glycosyltransferase [Clostridia bacterium]